MNLNKEDYTKEEMYTSWLWDKTYDYFYSLAIKQVEKEEGFWKSVFGVKDKIKDRHRDLFWKWYEEQIKQKGSDGK